MRTGSCFWCPEVAWGFLPLVLLAACQADQALAPQIAVDVSPASATVPTGGTLSLNVTVLNDAINGGVTWTLSCSSSACGTLSAAGSASGGWITYTAPAVAPTPASVTVMASSVTDPTRHGAATVAITTIAVRITPGRASLCSPPGCPPGTSSGHFTAIVSDDPSNAGVTWSVGRGTITPTRSFSAEPVIYSAPAGGCGSTIVRATSVADPGKWATATVTLINFGC